MGDMWSDTLAQRAVELWNVGHTASEIAANLGGPITRNAVIARLWRMRKAGAQIRRRPNVGESFEKKLEHRARKQAKTKSRPPSTLPPVQRKERIYPQSPDPLTATVFCIAELDRYHCRWPHGVPQTKGFGYCGRPRVAQLPYCEPHCRRAYPEYPQAVSVFVGATLETDAD